MSFTIYGIHKFDSTELRYVGQTNKPDPWLRARQHASERNPNDPFCAWLRSGIVVVTIDTCETRDEALFAERIAIRECLKRGFRLFNRAHTPNRKRRERKPARKVA